MVAAIEPLLLTTLQAAKALSLSRKTISRLTKIGSLQSIRIGTAVRYSIVELSAWVESNQGNVIPTTG